MEFTTWIPGWPDVQILQPNVFIVDQQVLTNKHMQHRGAFDFKDWILPSDQASANSPEGANGDRS